MIDKLLETLFDGDSFHKMEKMMPKKSKVYLLAPNVRCFTQSLRDKPKCVGGYAVMCSQRKF